MPRGTGAAELSPAVIEWFMLQVQVLDRSVDFYSRNGLAGSTQKAYYSAKKRYRIFCSDNSFSPLPISEHLLCRFVASLANESLCHNSYLLGM